MKIDTHKDTLREAIRPFDEHSKFTVLYDGNITTYDCKEALWLDCPTILDEKVNRVTVLYGYDILRVRIHMMKD